MSLITLKVWLIASYQGDEIVNYIEICQIIEKRLGCRIHLKLLSWVRIYESIVRAFREGDRPDLFIIGSTWVSTLAHLGYLAPVPKDYDIEKPLCDWMLKCVTYKDQVYGIPYEMSIPVMNARKSLVDERGISLEDVNTFERFSEVCHQIHRGSKNIGDYNHVPFGMQLTPNLATMHLYFAFLYKTGWEFPEIKPEGGFSLGRGEVVSTLEYMASLLQISSELPKDIHNYNSQIHDKFYYRDQCTFYLNYSNNIVSEIMNERISGQKTKRYISIYPVPTAGENTRAFSGGNMLVVASTCQHKEMAFEIIKILNSYEITKLDIIRSGNLPALNTEFWEKNMDDPTIRLLYDEIKNSDSYPVLPLWRNIEGVLSPRIYDSLFYFGKETEMDEKEKIEVVLSEVEKSINELLDLTWEM